jgi:hypothetical protein
VDVNDLDLLWPGFRPDEAEPELVVDADAVLAMAVPTEPRRSPWFSRCPDGCALAPPPCRPLAHGETEIGGHAVLLARDDERSGRAKRRTAGGVAPGDSGWWLFCIAVDVAAEKGGLN